MLTRGYSGARAYCQSKLAQVMFTFHLAEKLTDPVSRRLVGIWRPTWKPDGAPRRCHADQHCGTRGRGDPEFRHIPGARGPNRSLLQRSAEARAQSQAYDAEARQRLRALSFKLTGLSNDGFRPIFSHPVLRQAGQLRANRPKAGAFPRFAASMRSISGRIARWWRRLQCAAISLAETRPVRKKPKLLRFMEGNCQRRLLGKGSELWNPLPVFCLARYFPRAVGASACCDRIS